MYILKALAFVSLLRSLQSVIVINCADKLCTYCKTGWYGLTCERACVNCGGGLGCDKNSGSCIAQYCVPGYFGERCTQKCLSANCHNNKCNYYTGLCKQCNAPYYGHLCDKECSSNCISCSSTQGCSECKKGWYGSSCLSNCSYCGGGGICSSNGSCSSKTCKAGFYGIYCNETCSVNCAGDNSCDFSTGKCNLCPNNKYGNMCELDCPVGCRICQNSKNCDTCRKGFYGTVCTQTCPGCGGNGLCSRSNGICLSRNCKPKYYGSKCDQDCPSNCTGVLCDFITGECIFGCAKGLFGSKCSKRCSENCGGDGSCQRISGECYHGCRPGWSGMTCESECSNSTFGVNCSKKCARCKNDNCDSVYGTCLFGCEDGWSNVRCDIEAHGEDRSSIYAKLIGGGAGGFFSVILGVIIVCRIFRRRHAKEKTENVYMSEVDNSEDTRYSTLQISDNKRANQRDDGTYRTSGQNETNLYEEMMEQNVIYTNVVISKDVQCVQVLRK